jgi:hypothetical protein
MRSVAKWDRVKSKIKFNIYIYIYFFLLKNLFMKVLKISVPPEWVILIQIFLICFLVFNFYLDGFKKFIIKLDKKLKKR